MRDWGWSLVRQGNWRETELAQVQVWAQKEPPPETVLVHRVAARKAVGSRRLDRWQVVDIAMELLAVGSRLERTPEWTPVGLTFRRQPSTRPAQSRRIASRKSMPRGTIKLNSRRANTIGIVIVVTA